MELLRLFFEDVARLPIIEGKRAYLPLTRRIRRGAMLDTLAPEPGHPAKTHRAIIDALTHSLADLEAKRKYRNRPLLDLGGVSAEIEGFFDSPNVTIPPALARCLGKPKRNRDQDTEAFEELGWRCFYLLALLPPEQRLNFPELYSTSAVASHLQLVRGEASEALERLTLGTLRYVINIAVNYINQGVPYLDLVQEGVLALQIAATRHDERKGHFQQYAGIWIRQRLGRLIADSASLIRIPVHVTEVMEQQAALGDELAPEPELAEDSAARRWERSRAIAQATHYSLEQARLALMDDNEPLSFADILAAADDVEAEVEARSDADEIRQIVERHREGVNERNWQMLMLRFGFTDGEARTLEEVGQSFGLTRERVRQVEKKIFNKLSEPNYRKRAFGVFVKRPNRIGNPPPLAAVTTSLTDFLLAPQATAPPEDEAAIRQLIELYIERGRPKVWNVRRLRGRKALFREVLQELGKPTHYSIIHEKALERVPAGLHFSKGSTYTTLFYEARVFRSFGHAVFGLVEWPMAVTTVSGETMFDRCPEPLLPPRAHPGAFFESIEYGRRLLSGRSLSAAAFWHEMVRWAGPDAQGAGAQAAFDAWYAAGLLDRLHFASANGKELVLAAPPDTDLERLRRHCLATLARRVSKMPETLLALAALGRPTLAALQVTLFGSEEAGHDVATRLRLLASLGAVRPAGGEWRLTDVGRATLATLPDVSLPDAPDEEPDQEDDDLVELDFIDDPDLYELDLDDLS